MGVDLGILGVDSHRLELDFGTLRMILPGLGMDVGAVREDRGDVL